MKHIALILCLLTLTACGGGEPVPDNVCLVDGHLKPVEQCR